MMAAALFKSPELVLEKNEADAMAAAIAEVEALYSFSLTREQRVWLGLATTGAMIYGPRAYLILKRRKAEKGSPAPVPKTSASLPTPEPVAAGGEGGPKPGAPLTGADFGF